MTIFERLAANANGAEKVLIGYMGSYPAAYSAFVEVNGFSGVRASGSNVSWLQQNIEVVLPVFEQLRGETIVFGHGHRGLKAGTLLGVKAKETKLEVGDNIYAKYVDYIFRIRDGYHVRRYSLKTTRIWHPSVYAVYLMNR